MEPPAAAAADRRRFSQLVIDHRGRLFGYLRCLGASADLAEDCLQEAFVRAYRSFSSLRDTRKGAPWLYGIARHVFYDEMRRLEVRSRPLPEDVGPAAAETAADSLDDAQQARVLRAAVALLEPPRPELIELQYRAGLTMEEIAEVTGLPTGTVKTHLRRARATLRRALVGTEENSDE